MTDNDLARLKCVVRERWGMSAYLCLQITDGIKTAAGKIISSER